MELIFSSFTLGFRDRTQVVRLAEKCLSVEPVKVCTKKPHVVKKHNQRGYLSMCNVKQQGGMTLEAKGLNRDGGKWVGESESVWARQN